jgi:hypothetical protein
VIQAKVCQVVLRQHQQIFTFLSLGIDLKVILTGEPRIAGMIEMITIAQHGQRYGSLPVVNLMNSRFVNFCLGGGGIAPRLFLAFSSSFFFYLEDRKPICLILTKPLGRMCSAKSLRKSSPFMVLVLDFFADLSRYLKVTCVSVILTIR